MMQLVALLGIGGTIAAAGVVLQLVWGFYPLQASSWVWAWKFYRAYGTIPPFLLWTAIGAVAGLIVAALVVQIVAARVRSRTVHGTHGIDTLHGSAHLAGKADVREMGLWRDDGVVVGGWKSAAGIRPLRDEGPDHTLLIAPPRTGKGAGPILSTLLTWPDSVVVHDLRGENYGKSAGWQAQRGARVIKFDPSAVTGSSRWNPLAEIRVGTDHEIADAQNIAMMIIDPNGKGLVDFWMKSGFAWLSAAILHTLYRVRTEQDRVATLADVDMLLSALAIEGGLEALLLEMTEYDHGRQAVNDMVNSGAQNMRNRAAQERSGVQSSSQIDLTLYRDPIVAKNISESDFRLDDLQNGDAPVAVYLIVPPNDIDRLRPLLRVFWNLLLRRLMQSYDQAGNATHKRQLLLMFDEFTSVKKLEIFEQSMAYMGGYGIKAYLVVQTLMQLQEVYGRENAIFALCKIKAAYAPGDYGTAEILSQLTGKTTVVSAKHERSRKVLQLVGGNVSDRLDATGRQLLTPDEVMHLKPAKKSRDGKRIIKAGEMLTLVTGYPPIRGWQPLYFKTPALAARARIAPPDTNAARAAKATAAPIDEATEVPAIPPAAAPRFADGIRAAVKSSQGDH